MFPLRFHGRRELSGLACGVPSVAECVQPERHLVKRLFPGDSHDRLQYAPHVVRHLELIDPFRTEATDLDPEV
jgi:hypothetical protein